MGFLIVGGLITALGAILLILSPIILPPMFAETTEDSLGSFTVYHLPAPIKYLVFAVATTALGSWFLYIGGAG